MKTLFNFRSLFPRKQARRRGFTIIELLVAIGVTALLVTLMFTILTNILNVWNRSSGLLNTGNQARIVMDAISQDIQSAIMRRDNNAWFVATIQDNQAGAGSSGLAGGAPGSWTGITKPVAAAGSFEVNPGGANAIDDYRFGQAGVWLRLFTTPPDNQNDTVNRASAPRAVSYQLVRIAIGGVGNNQRSYVLFRNEVRPAASTGVNAANNTFDVGYDLFMDQNDNPSYNRGDGTNGLVGSIRRPNLSSVIANDVIDFGVKLYGRDTLGNDIELFPVRRNAIGVPIGPVPTAASVPFTFAASARDPSTPINVDGTGSVSYGYPVAAEVMVRILTPTGVRLIAALEAGNLTRPSEFGSDAEFWWSLAIQHSQVFTRRVQIRSTPL